MSRCFTFGCSFAKWHQGPTWADLVGQNFNKFYNLGQSGISNTNIHIRFIEADAHFNFKPEDTVLISLTGIGRFSFLVERDAKEGWFNSGTKETGWFAQGDLQNDLDDSWIFRPSSNVLDHREVITFFRDKYWNRKWGIYYTWLAVKSIKRTLEDNKINHKIFMGLDNNLYRDKKLLDLSKKDISMIEEIYSLIDIKTSIQEFNEQRKEYIIKDNKLHPDMDSYLEFIKKHLPEFYTDKTISYGNYMREIMKERGDKFDMHDMVRHDPKNIF